MRQTQLITKQPLAVVAACSDSYLPSIFAFKVAILGKDVRSTEAVLNLRKWRTSAVCHFRNRQEAQQTLPVETDHALMQAPAPLEINNADNS